MDVTPPLSQASAPSLTNSTSISVSYTASDSGGAGLASVELWVKPPGAGSYTKAATDSSPGASGSFPYTASGGDGTYSFYTRAVDGVGNYETAPGAADSTSLVDTTPPETKIDSGPASPSTDSTPTFHFSADEVANFECSLDGGAFGKCESPYTAPALADGARRLRSPGDRCGRQHRRDCRKRQLHHRSAGGGGTRGHSLSIAALS